jgi:hypothetical protein
LNEVREAICDFDHLSQCSGAIRQQGRYNADSRHCAIPLAGTRGSAGIHLGRREMVELMGFEPTTF